MAGLVGCFGVSVLFYALGLFVWALVGSEVLIFILLRGWGLLAVVVVFFVVILFLVGG